MSAPTPESRFRAGQVAKMLRVPLGRVYDWFESGRFGEDQSTATREVSTSQLLDLATELDCHSRVSKLVSGKRRPDTSSAELLPADDASLDDCSSEPLAEGSFTLGQVAKMCKVSRATVASWVDSGALESHWLPGRHRRVTASNLLAFAKEKGFVHVVKLLDPESLKADSSEPPLPDPISLQDEHHFTLGQVAAICKVSRTLVGTWFKDKFLRGYTLPGTAHRRVTPSELLQFAKRHGLPHVEAILSAKQDEARQLIAERHFSPRQAAKICKVRTDQVIDWLTAGELKGLDRARGQPREALSAHPARQSTAICRLVHHYFCKY